jgi:hypothetical protein
VKSRNDPGFAAQILGLRPDWDYGIRWRAAKNKKERLLEIAASGGEKPKVRRDELGKALENYMSASANAYDAEFSEKIRKLRPEWFRRGGRRGSRPPLG